MCTFLKCPGISSSVVHGQISSRSAYPYRPVATAGDNVVLCNRMCPRRVSLISLAGLAGQHGRVLVSLERQRSDGPLAHHLVSRSLPLDRKPLCFKRLLPTTTRAHVGPTAKT